MEQNNTSGMVHMEYEESRLKRLVLEMMMLVSQQLKNAQHALLEPNPELAEEVISREEKVNAYELSIERDCHNVLALQNPVATDLRFVLALFKINTQLERIGDHAEGIANYALELEAPLDKEAVAYSKIDEMFALAVEMIENVADSFENEDTGLARKIFKKDKALNKINKNAADTVAKMIKDTPKKAKQALVIFSTIKKLERTGDMCKNMAEEIIYHQEAKVIRHKKKKWKL